LESAGGPALRMLLFPDREGVALMAFLGGRDPSDRWEVFVDPHSAKIQGRRRFGTGLIDRIKAFHVELLLGKQGRLVVGAIGLLSLTLGASGTWLWWWTRPRSVDGPRRRVWTALDVHRQVGILGLVPTTVLAVTGASLIFRPYLAPIVERITGPMPLDLSARSSGDRTQAPPSLDRICELAARAYPDARITRLYLPEGPEGSFAVRLRLPEEGNPHGNTAILLDRYDGKVLRKLTSRSANSLQQILWYAPYPWHTGDALGLSGRWLAAASGAIPAILLVSGVLWWRRRIP
ncbi:PepSY-associated TM helix domain-containing protein, partial [Singulisphaera rosea]